MKKWKILHLPFNEMSTPCKKAKILNDQNNKCDICKSEPVWNDKPLNFQLDHIDGDHANNVRENLRMICPNCHSQTSTYCSKNMSDSGSLSLSEKSRRNIRSRLGKISLTHAKLKKQYNAHVSQLAEETHRDCVNV